MPRSTLAPLLQPLAEAGVEAVAVLPDQPEARDLAERVGEDSVHVLEHVEPNAVGVPGELALAPEQLRVALPDVRPRVGLPEPVREGGVERRERQPRRPPQLEPDRQQPLRRPPHGRVLEVDRRPPGAAGVLLVQHPE
jgi:hypothetical protein